MLRCSTGLFLEDATFGPHPGSVTLQSYNYPYLVLRYRDGAIYINVPDGTKAFASESSFIVRAPVPRNRAGPLPGACTPRGRR